MPAPLLPVIHQRRGTIVETVHPWSAVAVQHGKTLVHWGESVRTTWRSACKPVQLRVSLDVLGQPEVPETWLAVGSSSHSAEPIHLQTVLEILGRFQSQPEDLRCGTHLPISLPAMETILRANGQFSALHNNCSGKHAFMVAAARHAGWDLDYLPLEHPLQQKVLTLVKELCAAEPITAVDGCGVPTFDLPLEAIARAWSAIAAAMTREDDLLGKIGRAMAKYPELTSGTDRIDLAVVQHARLPLAVKVGAQGVFCMALPALETGVAIKIHSGVAEALPVAIDHVLTQLWPEGWSPVENWPALQVTNVVGRVVGDWLLG